MYNQKAVEWNHKTEVSVYKHPILTEIERDGTKEMNKSKENTSRKKYAEMNERERGNSDRRREGYYRKKVYYLTDMAIHNNLDSFVTLTFREDVREYEEAKHCWELFLKRLKYETKDNVKYIATYEKQEQRGVYHFHMLADIGFYPVERLMKIWAHGYVFIERVNRNCLEEQRRQISYIFKYIVKDIMEEKEGRNRRRKIYCSRNLVKPEVSKTLSDETVEEIIFANMEHIMESSTYDVKNHMGVKINEVDNVKIKKG